MATTTNYSWTTPDDTDLVKDGAAAIRSLGSAIDSTVFTNAGNAVQKSTIDAKGDLLVGTADNTITRLAVGTNDYVLTAASGESSGVKWAAIASATNDYQLLNAGGTALTGATTITVNITAYNKLLVRFDFASASASSQYSVRFNGDSGNNYYFAGLKLENATVYKDGLFSSSLFAGSQGNVGTNQCSGILIIEGAKAAGFKPYSIGSYGTGTTDSNSVVFNGFYTGTSAITSVSLISSIGNFDNGTIYVYGAN